MSSTSPRELKAMLLMFVLRPNVSDEPRRTEFSAPSAPSRVGPFVLSGLPSSRGLCRLAFHGKRHNPTPAGALLPSECRDQGPEIVAVLGRECRPVSPDFFDDGISPHAYVSMSSSGVQMTGGLSPSARQARSILPRTAAFAICLQFHVRR